MRRSGSAFVAIALLSLAACTQSRLAANANITLTGTLFHESGASVPHARVALTKGPDPGEVLFTFATLGLRCLASENIPTACPGARVTTSDGRGAFAYHLKGRDTQGTFGNASTLEIASNLDRAPGQTEGPASTIRFQVQTEALNLPLRFWESGVTLQGDGRSAVARWTDPPASLMPASANDTALRTSVVFLGRDGAMVWVFPGQRSGRALDERLLEDSTGSVSVIASARGIKVTLATGTSIDLAFRTGRYAYASTAGAPVSRGKPCFAYDARGNAVAQGSCRLTDGDYETAFKPRTEACATSGCASAEHDRASVDLGATIPVTLVAVRGCRETCDVETSLDGRTWRFAGSGSRVADTEAGDVAVELAPAQPARYVRVADSGGVDELTEVSVWDAAVRRAPVAGTLIVAPAAAHEPGAKAGSQPALSLAAWVAIVALIVAALGLVVALSRRRSSAV